MLSYLISVRKPAGKPWKSHKILSAFFAVVLLLSVVSIIAGLLSASRLSYSTDFVTPLPRTSLGANMRENFGGSNLKGQVNPDDVGFIQLFAIFFPCVTGFITGLNRSGDLKDPATSIPRGSAIATATSFTMYIALVLLMGAVFTGELLRTKLPAIGLHFAITSWPVPLVALIGVFVCGCGTSLLALMSAPKILRAVARDEVIPLLRPLTGTLSHELCLLVTLLIVAAFVCVGTLDAVAPIATLFYLINYTLLNTSTAILSFMQYPQWRPRFKYHHWLTSCLGAIVSVVYMFLINYIMAVAILVVVIALYCYIQYCSASTEWGTGLYALNIALAQKRLLLLEKSQFSKNNVAGNWRPQVMAFVPIVDGHIKFQSMLSFLSQLRKAGGLTVLAASVVGDLTLAGTRRLV